jgi:hypothetical protein
MTDFRRPQDKILDRWMVHAGITAMTVSTLAVLALGLTLAHFILKYW